MRILTVIGNRPQFIKAAAVSPGLRAVAEEVLVHTGQHHDDALSAVFFAELGLPAPERALKVAGGSNVSQTARMLSALEPVVEEVQPDAVLVYGDTNSTLAGALAGAAVDLPVAHVEAGMRSFDRSMPEELNRVLSDHVSTLLLCPSELAVANLEREGIGAPTPDRGALPARRSISIEMVGDVMVDVALAAQPRARARVDLVEAHGVKPGEYVLVTAHRAGNVDDPRRLAQLVEVLTALADEWPLVLPLHPRTRARLKAAGLMDRVAGAAHLSEPLGYFETATLLCHARAVVTDSGGLQKEAYLAAVPCITLRPSTEWVETVEAGWNTLVDLDPEAARAALSRRPSDRRPELYGDGRAGERVVAALRRHVDSATDGR